MTLRRQPQRPRRPGIGGGSSTFPIVIFVRRALPWYLLVGVAFHVIVSISFGLHSFYAFALCYVVFLDWPRAIAWTSRTIDSALSAPTRASHSR